MNNQQVANYSSKQYNVPIYTYHLPYAIRRDICNLLDADQTWRTLGGQFVGLDTTQLTLIGQAYMRNGSPTDELLNRLDSANVRISELCFYLRQMNHCRAIEILKPCLEFAESGVDTYRDIRRASTMSSEVCNTLDTPTPSFVDQPATIYGCGDNLLFGDVDQQPQWLLQDPHQAAERHQVASNIAPQAPVKCHRVNNQQNAQATRQPDINDQDPGDEIVRMACANNRKRTSISDQEVVNQLRLIMQITYNELKLASDDFSDSKILGNGGFASVYRGNWKGTDVAIKRLKCNLMDQALNELTILNSYRIDNILPIYGISIDGPEACLVYQFMANGSLEDRLSCKNETPPLTWNQRALIGEGVAKGLYYLHTLRDKPLVHGDAKSANVLLDAQFVPKLGDFGLARQVFKGKNPQAELATHCTVSSIHGTSVYLPPEYLRHKILSPAVDVYSYGIVLLEMATGKRAYDGKRLLIDMVEDETKSLAPGQVSYRLKDPRLNDDTQNDLKIWYELLIRLGLECAHRIKKKRLDIGQVLTRFANFRSSASLCVGTNNNLPYGLLNSNGSTRTLTPDLSTRQTTDNGQSLNDHQKRQLIMMRQQLPQLQPAVDNVNLMSVEEESEMAQFANNNQTELDQHHHQQQQQDGTNDLVALSVEAMIPLLTELGVKQE